MPETHLIDPIADPAWLDFVDGGTNGEIFHHPQWLELLQAQYGYQFQACCIGNGGGIEVGIPIARIESRLTGRRLVSLPFSDICSPILSSNAGPNALDALGLALAEECERTGLDLTVHGPLSGAPDTVVQDAYFRHLLTLASDSDGVRRGYSKSHARGIKKARREGLTGARLTDSAALDAFYSLHVKTRRRLGVPTQPKRFIRRFEKLFDAGLGFVWLILDEGSPIAAAVFLAYGGTLTYKYGAADAAKLGKRPNNLLFSEVIDWGCAHGFQALDFGRTDALNEGLRSFKRGWGAREIGLPYTYFTDRAPSSGPGLMDRVVASTIKRTPSLVGRAAGAALYRHYA